MTNLSIGKLFAAGWLVLLAAFPLFSFSVPPLTGRIVDEASFFPPAEKKRIGDALQSFEKATGGQLFVAVLKPFDDVSLEEAALKLMDKWKPGDKGKDNGAILLIVPQTRKMRLEIGYGWEGAVNDAKAGDIIRLMAPYFRKNRPGDGVIAAIKQLTHVLTGGKDISSGTEKPQKDEFPHAWFNIFFIISFLILFFRRGRVHGRGGFRGGGGGFGGGRGGRGGGGGASGSW